MFLLLQLRLSIKRSSYRHAQGSWIANWHMLSFWRTFGIWQESKSLRVSTENLPSITWTMSASHGATILARRSSSARRYANQRRFQIFKASFKEDSLRSTDYSCGLAFFLGFGGICHSCRKRSLLLLAVESFLISCQLLEGLFFRTCCIIDGQWIECVPTVHIDDIIA